MDMRQKAITIASAMAEAVRTSKSGLSAGQLYSQLMGCVSQRDFDALVGRLVSAGLVHRSSSHWLTWVGPASHL